MAFAGWTAFVWLTRIRNAARDGDSLLPYALSVSFLVLAIGVLGTLGRDRRWILGLAAWTVVVWPVRLVDIATSDHGAGFVIVHVAIGGLSIALAGLATRTIRHQRRAARAAAA
jgi:hypothetical protein